MSLVLDVMPDQTEDTVYVRLPHNGGVVRLRVMTHERPDRRDPRRKHRSVRAVIDAPESVEIVREATLERRGVDVEAWARGEVDLRGDHGHDRARTSVVATIAPPRE